MLLRTRVTAIALVAILTLTGLLAYAVGERERLFDARHAEAVGGGQRAIWREATDNTLAAVEKKAAALLQDGIFVADIDSGDHNLLSDRVAALAANSSDRDFRIEVTSAKGEILFSNSETLFPTAPLPKRLMAKVLAGESFSGASFDVEDGMVAVASNPVVRDGKVIAALTVARNLDGALRRLSDTMGADLVVVSLRGRALAGTAVELWHQLSARREAEAPAALYRVAVGDKVLSVVTTPIEGIGIPHLANLVSIRDVTASAASERRIAVLSVVGGGVVVVLLAAGLSFYLAYSFQPVQGAIRVLNALSEGDTSITIETSGRRDEVAQIAGAVDVFRAKALALNHLTRARERSRRRQERMIRRQMTALAATLDQVQREAVLADLNEIQTVTAKDADGRPTEAGGGQDGLALMALVFRKLADRITDQQQRLHQLIEELREALRTKAAFMALQQEIDLAARLQMAVLPKEAPNDARINLAGQMIPAKEVGGDFYDFAMLDQHHLAIAIADVSGKGIGAAFFMAVSRTMLKALSLIIRSPGEAVTRFNDMLSQENEECMFVTLFYGVVDLRTGRMAYVNGGHNRPVLRRADGAPALLLPGASGPALGLMEGVNYVEHEVDLHPGDLLVLYTDGVTESTNTSDELFGDEKLLHSVDSMADAADAKAVSETLIGAVRAHEDGAQQADDITLVVLSATDLFGRG